MVFSFIWISIPLVKTLGSHFRNHDLGRSDMVNVGSHYAAAIAITSVIPTPIDEDGVGLPDTGLDWP